MKKFRLTIICALAALAAAAQNNVEERIASRNILHFPAQQADAPRSRAEASISVNVKLKYNSPLLPLYVCAFNSDVNEGVSYSSNMRGVVPMALPQGKYNIMAEFYNMDTDIYHYVVLEDVEIADGAEYLCDAATACNYVHFKMLLPDGSEAMLADTSNPMQKATVAKTVIVAGIAHDDYGYVLISNGVQDGRDLANYKFGDERFDLWINDVSDRWHMFQQRLAFASLQEDAEADAYAAFLVAKGGKAQVVENDPATYSPRGYFHAIDPTEGGKDVLDAEYSVAFTPMWHGVGHYYMATMITGQLPTPRINHTFYKGYDPATSPLRPLFSMQRLDGYESYTGFSIYTPNPDGTIEYPVNGYEDYLEFTNIHALGSDYKSVFSQYPGHPALSFTAADCAQPMAAAAPFYSLRIGSLAPDHVYGPALVFSAKSLGLYGENRMLDIENTAMTVKQNGQTLPFAQLDEEWAKRFASLGYMDGEVDLRLENGNASALGAPCKSIVDVHWSYASDDVNPPYLQALQVRQADGSISSEVSGLKGAKLVFAAGDYDYFYGEPENYLHEYMAYYWDKCEPLKAAVEYSAHQAGQWTALEVAELEGQNDIAGIGRVFEANLDGIAQDGLLDLRIRIEDNAGNYQQHLIERAIKVQAAGGIEGVAAPAAEPVEWYTIDGRRAAGRAPGLYIARCADGSVRKIIK